MCYTIQHGNKAYEKLTTDWELREAAGNRYILLYVLYQLGFWVAGKTNYSSLLSYKANTGN